MNAPETPKKIEEIFKATRTGCTSSASADRLAVLMAGFASLPESKLNKLKEFSLKWDSELDELIPVFDAVFYE